MDMKHINVVTALALLAFAVSAQGQTTDPARARRRAHVRGEHPEWRTKCGDEIRAFLAKRGLSDEKK